MAPEQPTLQTITTRTADRIHTITLNRPKALNACSNQLTADLADALRLACGERDIRVIIITGADRAFCAGQDLVELQQRYGTGEIPDLGRDLEDRYHPIVTLIRDSEKPVLAAVNGVAAGAGFSLALACDLRIASEHASFIQAFINVGLVPDAGSTWHLPRLIGYANAFELCCTGRTVSAEEALHLGIVSRVVPADRLMPETESLARNLATRPPPAISLTKRLLNQSAHNPLSAQLAAEAATQCALCQSGDHLEGVSAFLEKRSPTFTGQ